MCLMARGSDKQSSNLPFKWALADSCSPPRKTMYSSFNLEDHRLEMRTPPYDEEPHSPNVEIFGVTGAPAATKETESHDGRREPGDELGDETVRSEKKEGSESI